MNAHRSGIRSPLPGDIGVHPRGRPRHQVEVTRVRGGRPAPPARRARPAPQRPLRLALWTTALLTVGTIFGAAVFHVLLVQSQFRLDGLEHQAGVEQQRYEQLRLDVARLAAPERIVAAAQQRLGMVVPPGVGYLMAPTPAGSEPDSATGVGEWSQVKPHLVAGP